MICYMLSVVSMFVDELDDRGRGTIKRVLCYVKSNPPFYANQILSIRVKNG